VFAGNVVSNSHLISAATISGSPTTGALVVNGGIGVGGSIYSNAGISTYGVYVNQIFAAPVLATPTTTSGNFNPGTYYFKVVAIDSNGGSTLASNETSVTLATPGGFILTWGGVAGASSYQIFYGTVSGAQNNFAQTSTSPFTLNNTSMGISGVLPTVNSTGSVSARYLNAANIYVYSNSPSISVFTGAVRVSGGVGIANGNLYIGGSGGNAIVATGNVNITGNILPGGANVTYNLGSTTQWWNTFYGVSTQAQYADLAENYVADAEYAPGTVVVFDGTAEITVTTQDHDPRIAGVISTNPAYLMNAAMSGLPVALQGRTPCQVLGPVAKGDLLVSSNLAGVAQKLDKSCFEHGCVIGKSLENIASPEIQLIEIVVGLR
jgi:hypothetical protein